MKRFILFAYASCLSSTSTAWADDYLLRVDTVGYVDQPASEKNPKETVLRSIEVMARPNEPFRGKVTFGTATLSVSGEFHPNDKGGFALRIRHVHSVVQLGQLVTGKNGCWEPVVDMTAVDTNITVGLNKPVLLGGCLTASDHAGKPELRSKEHAILLLTKYKPKCER